MLREARRCPASLRKSLASPTLGDTWLTPKRQNVLVRDICMPALLGCSRRESPQLSLSAGWQNVIRGSYEQTQTVPRPVLPPSPPMQLLAHPSKQGKCKKGLKSTIQCLCFILVCKTARYPHQKTRPFTAIRPSEVQSKMPGPVRSEQTLSWRIS